MSRILAIHRYYWPDAPPYASLLRSIAREWSHHGYQVDVLAGQPSYKTESTVAQCPSVEQVDDVTVRRVSMQPDRRAAWRRPYNVVRFPLLAAFRVLVGRRYDVVMCSTVPPVLLGWSVSLVARVRGASFVYHCMDLHPEIGRLSGEFARPWLFRLLSRLDLATCRRSSAIVVLSEDMREAVVARDPGLADRTVVLTNFELPDFEDAHSAESPLPPDPERDRIVFAGNLGRFQGLETITRAVLADDPALDRVELVFMGEGAAKSDLQRLVGAVSPQRRRRVLFLPHSPPATVRALLATCDFGLVSLTPGVIQYAYPSKLATYLSAGLPVLVAVEATSAMARTVVAAGAGAVLPTSDRNATQATLLELLSSPDVQRGAAARAQALWNQTYSAERLLPCWSELLDEVIRRAPAGVRL